MPLASAAKRPRICEALELIKMPTLVLNVQRTRPLEALELLKKNLPRDEAGLAQWRHGARVAAVMGSHVLLKASSRARTKHAACVLHTAFQCA